jgi:GlpG protein
MRLIYTTDDADMARTFANFLSSEGIENQLEMVKRSDWGENDYGDMAFKVWIVDEDDAEAAEKWAAAFEQDPQNPMFLKAGSKTTVIPAILSGRENTKGAPGQKSITKPEPVRTITSGIFLLCLVFYLIGNLTAPHVKSLPAYLPSIPIMSSPIEKQFYYDYPYAFELVDKLVQLFGVEKLQTPEYLPIDGKNILKEFQNTPYWEGFYDQLVAFFKDGTEPKVNAPMFEKLQRGEVWRLFTPCLMHGFFLHIFFNMIWLLILGKQLEERLDARRYMLLILLTGIFSNTCQYLMSGPGFIGFSGVISGMVAFIVVRQKFAPWEGYPLESSTSMFVLFFICSLLAIQLVSFYLEINHNTSLTTGMANTAHVTGAVMGILLGLLPFFRKTPKRQARS